MMHAGTIGLLERPADTRLETWFRDDGLPGIEVERTQESLDDGVVQVGVAAKTVETTETHAVPVFNDGEATALDVGTEPTRTTITSEWIADVTGSGIIAAESTDGEGEFAFPFDIIMSRADRYLDRPYFEIRRLHEEWTNDGELQDVWMTSADDGTGASIEYHDAANVADTPTIGVGFEAMWQGTYLEGVVYQSGYVAVYNSSTATEFIRFVEDRLLPYAAVPDDSSGTQSTLEEASNDTEDDSEDDTAEQTECDDCGHEPTKSDLIEDAGDLVCVVCKDKREEDREQAVAESKATDGGTDDGE